MRKKYRDGLATSVLLIVESMLSSTKTVHYCTAVGSTIVLDDPEGMIATVVRGV